MTHFSAEDKQKSFKNEEALPPPPPPPPPPDPDSIIGFDNMFIYIAFLCFIAVAFTFMGLLVMFNH